MAVTLYCGRPGSGKSYGVVEHVILPALQSYRRVITNIPLNLDAIEQDYPGASQFVTQFKNDEVNGEFLIGLPGGAVIVIDECWRYWASGQKANEIPQAEKEFFAEHRHKAGDDQLTQEIVLVTQSPSQIAKYCKDLIDKTVMTVKADKVGLATKFQVRIFSGCIPSLERPGEPNTTGMGTYKPEIYKYYKSHTKSETGLAGVEIKADKRGSIFGHWYIRYLTPAVIIASIWGAFYLMKFFSGETLLPNQQKEAPTVTSPHAPPSTKDTKTVSHQPQQKPKLESKRFRVSGVIYHDGVQVVHLSDDEGQGMLVYAKDCVFDLNGPQCEINGEIVNKNTGKRPPKPRPHGQNRPDMMDIAPTFESES